MFKHMEILETIYGGGSYSKNTQQEKYDHASSGRKKNGGASALTYNPEPGRSSKRKRNDAGHPSDAPNGAKKIRLIHGPGHSLEGCKVLKEST